MNKYFAKILSLSFLLTVGTGNAQTSLSNLSNLLKFSEQFNNQISHVKEEIHRNLNANPKFNTSELKTCSGNINDWNDCAGKFSSEDSNGKKEYEGEFRNGKPSGIGTQKRSNRIYYGEFKDGLPNGTGDLRYEDSDLITRMVGGFKNGKALGNIVRTTKFLKGGGQSGICSGILDDKGGWVGLVNCRFETGHTYSGGIDLNGYFFGEGTYTWPDGWKYIGGHKENAPDGFGVKYNERGIPVNSGIWQGGVFIQAAAAPPQAITNNATANLSTNAEITSTLTELKKSVESLKSQQIENEGSNITNSIQNRNSQQATMITPSANNKSESKVTLNKLANRKALVIGNDNYKSVAKLENAREDAKTIAANLSSVGYQVTLKLDLTEKEMKASLRTFASQVEGGDEVMFFFAGHGVQLGATNYLLPTDIGGESEAQVRDESIQLQRILDDMSDRKAKFTLAMIDACRDNPFKSSGRAIGGRGLAPTTAATGQMVIFSAGTGQQALDKLNNADKNKNGLFTRVFIQEMQKPSQSIDRVVKNVRNQVAELAKSVGHEQVPAIYDQVLGDFYFKK
jgi:hypothetical protein